MELPLPLEPPPLQAKGAELHHHGGTEPRQRTTGHQLPTQHLFQQVAAGPQGAHQQQLAPTLSHAGLGLGQQHQQRGHCHQPQHQRQCPAHLLRYLRKPRNQIIHIDKAHRGVAADQLHLGSAPRLGQSVTTKPGTGEGCQQILGEDHVEVGPHIVPLDAAQTGDSGAEAAPLDGKGEHVPQLDIESLGQLAIHRHLAGACEPFTGHQLVVDWQGYRGSEVEFPIDPLAATAGPLAHRLTGDMGQPATHHGIEIGSGGPGCRQFAQDPLPLVLGHIDQKTVGRIDGKTSRKLIQQIDPGRPEQAKQHQRQRKARQLKQAATALARQVGQRQPQGMRPAHFRPQPQHQGCQQGQQPHQQAHAPHQTQRQPHIGGKAPDQRKQPEQADRQSQPGGNPRLQLPAQYPQRRHLQQPQEGHKSEQQGDKERHCHAQRKGAPGGGRQIRRQQVPQQLQGDPLHGCARHQT